MPLEITSARFSFVFPGTQWQRALRLKCLFCLIHFIPHLFLPPPGDVVVSQCPLSSHVTALTESGFLSIEATVKAL
ncbi:hypothetical protein ETA_11360 [Erwinia tasmaniensis Et1/99]|uniref:Uncharacterized protein n=1 Tax=Erwinia tasmaniensis (strain DSM 17950 / CFBP 7177 / CIP 109463 / NCPPB 4357 / Et1/99) TaxID=465817 RepID=B2VJ19_ERWT9|nr:hypothetical protein ETA_11360 [Erwinia tasmaniensis Et1/99]